MCGRLKSNRISSGLGKEYGTGFHGGCASASQKASCWDILGTKLP